MKTSSSNFLRILGIVLISTQNIAGQVYLDQIYSGVAHNFSLEGSLKLLNLAGKQPDYVQNIYTVAYNTLSVDPQNTFSDLAGNNEFVQLCQSNGMILTGGPMLGNITSDGVKIWVRTLYPARVEVQVAVENTHKIYGPVNSTKESDLTAVVDVSGLKPGIQYPYRIFIDGKPVNLDVETFFKTLPPENQPVKTNIVFGSCFHRVGLCNKRLAKQIETANPSAFLINGDIAVQDRKNNIAMHRADYLLRDFHPAWKKLVATIPVYTTWDDHDYFDDDLYNIPKGYTQKDKESVCKIFRTSWNNPPYGIKGDHGGVFFRTRIGPADVIMLDNRYFREHGNFLGDEQMKWLEEQLLDCKGPFIILSNGTMWSDYVSDGKDSWGVFDPEGREKIFNLIEKNKIGGVLLISGDRHGARGFKIPRPSGFNFYEFEPACLGGRVGPPAIRSDWKTQLFGISGEYAFGKFAFDTTLPDPEVTFSLINEFGIIFYEITLSRSQLTP